jgi:modulator of FtsH protease HflK
MPWSSQGGGWQGGNGRGPWGRGPGGPQNRGGGTPPDLEEIIRKSQERLKTILPGGSGAPNRFSWLLILVALAAVWVYNSVYQVQPNEQGVVLRFGAYNRTSEPGLNFIFWPAETVERLQVLDENQMSYGGDKGQGLMLAGDQNIVDIKFTVLWKIREANDFLFNVRDQEQLVRVISESAMREVVGRTPADVVRTRGRLSAQQDVQALIQGTLDRYKAGILITAVNLEKADPPPQVIDAFEEVQRAEQNQNRFIREAEQYRNKILGDARGEAAKIVEDAKGYRTRVVQEAEGEAQRFISVYDQYRNAKDVTRKRLFLETMEGVLGQSNKVIIEEGGNSPGVVPYLPLPEIQKRQQSTPAPRADANTSTGAAQQ